MRTTNHGESSWYQQLTCTTATTAGACIVATIAGRVLSGNFTSYLPHSIVFGGLVGGATYCITHFDAIPIETATPPAEDTRYNGTSQPSSPCAGGDDPITHCPTNEAGSDALTSSPQANATPTTISPSPASNGNATAAQWVLVDPSTLSDGKRADEADDQGGFGRVDPVTEVQSTPTGSVGQEEKQVVGTGRQETELEKVQRSERSYHQRQEMLERLRSLYRMGKLEEVSKEEFSGLSNVEEVYELASLVLSQTQLEALTRQTNAPDWLPQLVVDMQSRQMPTDDELDDAFDPNYGSHYRYLRLCKDIPELFGKVLDLAFSGYGGDNILNELGTYLVTESAFATIVKKVQQHCPQSRTKRTEFVETCLHPFLAAVHTSLGDDCRPLAQKLATQKHLMKAWVEHLKHSKQSEDAKIRALIQQETGTAPARRRRRRRGGR